MRLFLALLLVAAFSLLGQPQAKQPPQNRVEITELSSNRSQGKINVDGRVKNTGLRPLAKLVIQVDLLDTDRKVISTRHGPVEEEMLQPDQECEFHFYVPDQPRAALVRLGAESAKYDYVELVKRGPYPIE